MSRKTSNIGALTGSIATGKSYVSAYFKNNFGFQVVDADKIGHAVLERPEIIGIVEKNFGSSVIKDGSVNRQALGKLVFSDYKKLVELNGIIHPMLIKEAIQAIELFSENGPVIFEAAVLFEAGWHKYFNTIILTTCERKIQLERIIKRDQINEIEAMARIKSQIPFEEKLSMSDYAIDTSRGIEEITCVLDEIAEKLINGNPYRPE